MARFRATLDIWPLSDAERAALPVGQWVTAGPDGPRGRFYGQGRASTVVAWVGNARRSRDYAGYMRAIRDYGRSVRMVRP
ncbi:hypothetical protein DK26_14930 [Bosea sp. WAO]|nr:hypothetical protein DK26_14930 [Bosea sp. WAO]